MFSALFTFIELVVPLSSTLNGTRWQKVLETGIYLWLMNSQSQDGGQIASTESIWGKDRRWEQVFLLQTWNKKWLTKRKLGTKMSAMSYISVGISPQSNYFHSSDQNSRNSSSHTSGRIYWSSRFSTWSLLLGYEGSIYPSAFSLALEMTISPVPLHASLWRNLTNSMKTQPLKTVAFRV